MLVPRSWLRENLLTYLHRFRARSRVPCQYCLRHLHRLQRAQIQPLGAHARNAHLHLLRGRHRSPRRATAMQRRRYDPSRHFWPRARLPRRSRKPASFSSK